LTRQAFDREYERRLLARMKRGGKTRAKAIGELCEMLKPCVSVVTAKIHKRYPMIDRGDIEQTVWVQVLSLARSHDTTKSRLHYMIQAYGAKTVELEVTYQEQRQPCQKYSTETFWHDPADIDDIHNI